MDKPKLLCFDLSSTCKRNVSDVCINGGALEFNKEEKYLEHKINKRIGILKKNVPLFT